MHHPNLLKTFSRLLATFTISLFFSAAAIGQIIYGAGAAANNGALYNKFYIVNGTTGVATAPTVANTLPAGVTETVAIGVSPINGLVYWVERAVATPRIGTWNPQTGATTIIGNAGTPAGIGSFLRATFCPDGRFYIAGNGSGGGAGAEIYQIDPTTLAVSRTLVITNLPTNGSGDVVCTSNGDLYAVAQSTDATIGSPYQLYRVTAAQVASAVNNVGFNAVLQGNISTTAIPNTQAFNGLSERNDGQLVASVAVTTTGTYVIATSTGVATTLTTAPGASLVDLSREFPRDISVNKTVTPTTALQGRTITYNITAQNAGPAVAGGVRILDILDPNIFNVGSVTWTCSVLAAGSATALPTACATPSGTGNVSTTVNLSINATIGFIVTAPLLTTYTGTASNSVSADVGGLFDSSAANNVVTVTSTVSPATALSVSKTNGTTTVGAGRTTTYTVVYSNGGPGNAPNSIISDTPSAGLTCTTASCTATAGATCPAPYNPGPAPVASLLSGTLAIATFNANSSLTFLVNCGITATGQ